MFANVTAPTKVIFLVMLLSSLGWATSYTATVSGHCNANATWGGSGHPVSGDIFVVNSGVTVSCDSSDGPFTFGTSAATTCTTDGTVNQGATFAVGNGAVITAQGNFGFQHGATLTVTATTTSATVNIQPGSGATCGLTNPNTGTGAFSETWAGTSPSVLAILNCDLSAGGTKCTWPGSGGGTQKALSASYFKLNGFGTASSAVGNGSGISVASLHFACCNVIANSGNLYFIGPADGTSEVTFFQTSFINCLSGFCGRITDATTITTATRGAGRITIANTPAHSVALIGPANFVWAVAGTKCGVDKRVGDSADHPCVQTYNGGLSVADTAADSAGIIVNEGLTVNDGEKSSGTATGNVYGIYAGDGQVFNDDISYFHWDNAHPFNGPSTASGTATIIDGMICDGNGYLPGDTSNCVTTDDLATVENSLTIYAGGSLHNGGGGTGMGFNDLNNTSYQSDGDTLGSQSGQMTGLVVERNLFVFPYDPHGLGGQYISGVTMQSPFDPQNAFTVDYNGYYGQAQPTSPETDTGITGPLCGVSTSLSCPSPNAATSTVTSYYAGIGNFRTGLSGCALTTGTTATNVVFTSCSTSTMQISDIVNTTGSGRPQGTVASITNGSTFVLTSPGIAGLASGATVQVSSSIGSSGSFPSGVFYGTTSGFGTHDFHASPHFADTTRNLCNYWVRVMGGTAVCNWLNVSGGKGNRFISSGITGTTVITDASAHFNSQPVYDNVDTILIGTGSSTAFRCFALVTAHTDTTLTFTPSCTGLTSGDSFSFNTATYYLGQEVVKINGYDLNGNPATFNPLATSVKIRDWIRAGYRPQLSTYCNAGDGSGLQVGAVACASAAGRAQVF